MHKFRREYRLGALFPLLIRLRAIREYIDQRFVISHSCIDRNFAPQRSINALPGTQLRAEIVFAGGIAVDEIACKNQQMR